MNHLQEITEKGFLVIRDVYDVGLVNQLLAEIDVAIERGSDGNIKSSLGETYAARNLVELNPRLLTVWQNRDLQLLLAKTLGKEFGLVRVLYFDKHQNRTWSLPWHKDMTIAVKDNTRSSTEFTNPTRKSGVDHVEAPVPVLENMLTLRIHLDDVTADNGPLQVAVGSHRNGKAGDLEYEPTTILAQAGDVLAMRPLISHASGSSTPGTNLHRRILHLEFSGTEQLEDGYEWHLFHRFVAVQTS